MALDFNVQVTWVSIIYGYWLCIFTIKMANFPKEPAPVKKQKYAGEYT